MKASDLFVKCLEAQDVEYVFTVPGEENLDLLESLRESKIKVIINRHEQCSAFMAATYGRLTGKPGICMSTLGPGATNLVTGIAYAQLGGMPVIALTGQKGVRENVQANFQVLDIVNMLRPLTKSSKQIIDPKAIPRDVREAFKAATEERLGVTHLELPEDIASEDVPKQFQPQQAVKIRRPVADEKSVKLAADLIKQAKQPVIIVSSRGQRNLVSKAIKSFAEKTNIYVIGTQMGKGIIGDDHPNSLFSFGIHKHDLVNCVLDSADLIITVGYSTQEYPPAVWNKDLSKKILHIDFNRAVNDLYYAPSLGLIGDIGTSLANLEGALKGYKHDGAYPAKVKAALQVELFEKGADDNSFPLKPRRIVADCRKVLGKEDIICLDNGIYKLWFSRHYPTYAIGTYLVDNALATMGAGLPSAMAAKLVSPNKKVLAVCGDGGFMMNSQEMETAVRLKLNVVILILNDNGYGFIKWKQSNHGFKNFGLEYGNPDFVQYAESYGATGFNVESADQLIPTLEKAFKQKGPVIVHCPIDYVENDKTWGEKLDNIVCPV